MKITIREVAQAANVSLGTASRALNGDPTVNPDHLQRVQRAASKLNYRRLRSRSRPAVSAPLEGRAIAMVLLGMDRSLVSLPVIAEAVHGVEVALSKAGARMMLVDVPDVDVMPPSLRDSRLDGVILKGALQGDIIGRSTGEVMTRIRQVPSVWLLGRPEKCVGDCVGSNDYRIGQIAADHLLEMGHRRAVFINPKPDHVTFTNRELAFTSRFVRAGGEVRSLIGDSLASWTLPLRPVRDVETVQQLVDDAIAEKPRPTAIFCPADSIAALVYRALAVRSIAVGRDISIISVNNERQLTQYLHPVLTTIDIHASSIGQRCVDRLAWLLEHPGSPDHADVGIEPTLVVGESVTRLPVKR